MIPFFFSFNISFPLLPLTSVFKLLSTSLLQSFLPAILLTPLPIHLHIESCSALLCFFFTYYLSYSDERIVLKMGIRCASGFERELWPSCSKTPLCLLAPNLAFWDGGARQALSPLNPVLRAPESPLFDTSLSSFLLLLHFTGLEPL